MSSADLIQDFEPDLEPIPTRDFSVFGRFHPHELVDYNSYLGTIRACKRRRCKAESSASICDKPRCQIKPCRECNRVLFDIRNEGWMREQGSLARRGMPPCWIVPSLRAGSPDVALAGAIVNLPLDKFIQQVGVCETRSEAEYSNPDWLLTPDYWREHSHTIYAYMDAGIELHILANNNIRCILHSRECMHIAVITQAVYHLSRNKHMVAAVGQMLDQRPTYVPFYEYDHSVYGMLDCRLQSCKCVHDKHVHCVRCYKFTQGCADCTEAMRVFDSSRQTYFVRLAEWREMVRATPACWGGDDDKPRYRNVFKHKELRFALYMSERYMPGWNWRPDYIIQDELDSLEDIESDMEDVAVGRRFLTLPIDALPREYTEENSANSAYIWSY